MSVLIRFAPASLSAEKYHESIRWLEETGDFPRTRNTRSHSRGEGSAPAGGPRRATHAAGLRFTVIQTSGPLFWGAGSAA